MAYRREAFLLTGYHSAVSSNESFRRAARGGESDCISPGLANVGPVPKETPQKPRNFDLTHLASIITIVVLLGVYAYGQINTWIVITAIGFLGLAVVTAVHHAEVVATRVGASLGALILALSVTVIEVGLIVSLMTNDTPDSALVARDTIFSAVIIVTNGIIGVCLLLGGLKHRELGFNASGTASLLTVLAVLSGLTMVLPNYTTSTSGPTYNTPQLIFVSAASLLMYASLVYSQTKSHKEYFEVPANASGAQHHHPTPSKRLAFISFGALLVSLVAVIGLAKLLSPSIEAGVTAIGAPRATVGIVIALLVLLPESWAAVSAARVNQTQTSLNLALGSGAASIALTIPVVSIFSIVTGRNLMLGLDNKGVAILILTFIASGLTLGRGSATALAGLIHLILLFAFIALSFIP